jgi:dTDP-6-deoxy-L-talose 4-dehydrogenase (NAD+)
VLVTGATGFVGQHLVRCLIGRGHQVLAVARDEEKARKLDWYPAVQFEARDIFAGSVAGLADGIDAVAHLAWPGLPNYAARFHFEENLPRDYAFLKRLVETGVRQVLVTGTCLEYGARASGCLSEGTVTAPDVPYALAKDTLHRFLQFLKQELPFILQWARLFYMHGVGQNPNSLLSLLDTALREGRATFEMSQGEQLRDYLPVTSVAELLASVLEHPEVDGPINICSGVPISVRRLVEKHLAERQASIELKLGVYPYPSYEPLAFWGASEKLERLRGLEG